MYNCIKRVNETNYTKYKINLIGFPFKVKSIEIDNEEVSFDSMKLIIYFIVANLTFYISLENKKTKNVETFDLIL
jgi:hypothetical protein